MAADHYVNCIMQDRVGKMEREIAETSTMIREMSKRFAEIVEATHEMQKEQHALMFGDQDSVGIKTDIFLLKQEETKRQKNYQIIFTALIGCILSSVGLLLNNIWEKIR